MVWCSVKGCKNNSLMKDNKEHIKFHTFPKDKNMSKLWVKLCEKKNINLKHATICSIHFSDDSYRLEDRLLNVPIKKKKLAKNAVPTLHLPTEIKVSERFSRNEKRKMKNEVIKLLAESEENSQSDCKETITESRDEDYTSAADADVLSESDEKLSIENQDEEILIEEILDEEFESVKENLEVNDELLKKKRCGEIFLLQNGNFNFNCTFCNDVLFEQCETLLEHIRCYHLDFKTFDESATEDQQDSMDVEDFSKQEQQQEEEEEVQQTSTARNFDINSDSEENDDSYFLEQFAVVQPKVERPPKKNPETGEIVDPKVCRYCQRRCRTPAQCFEHECLHTGEKLHQCDICGKLFRVRTKLSIHLKMHSDDKPFKCDVCNATFVVSTNYRIHMWSHTKEKPYKCDYCDKSFSTRPTRNYHHAAVHSGQKPYKCSKCDKCFATNASLRTHFKTHTKVLLFPCDQCDEAFGHKRKLKSHVLFDHLNKKRRIRKKLPAKTKKSIETMKIDTHMDVEGADASIINDIL